MNRRLTLLPVLILTLLLLPACAGLKRGAISTDAIDGAVLKVSARHDTYVSKDAALPAPDRAAALAESERLRSTVAAAGDYVSVEAIGGDVETVTARHDKYVAQDEALDPGDRRIFLRTSTLLRDVVDAARSR